MYNYKQVGDTMDYGKVTLNIEKILKEKNISKNRLCKDLDILRPNLNRYCRNEFQRIDAGLLCKLCYYLECSVDDLITYEAPRKENKEKS